MPSSSSQNIQSRAQQMTNLSLECQSRVHPSMTIKQCIQHCQNRVVYTNLLAFPIKILGMCQKWAILLDSVDLGQAQTVKFV